MGMFLLCRPGGIPARNSKGERLLLYIGVIDILQSYRLKKKLEHAMKAMVHDGVSCAIGKMDSALETNFTSHLVKRRFELNATHFC